MRPGQGWWCVCGGAGADHHVALPHDPLDPLAIDPHTLSVQLDGHPRGSVGATGVGVDDPDLLGEDVLGGGASLPGRPARGPPVEPGAGNRQDPAQPLDAERGRGGRR